MHVPYIFEIGLGLRFPWVVGYLEYPEWRALHAVPDAAQLCNGLATPGVVPQAGLQFPVGVELLQCLQARVWSEGVLGS